MHYAYIIKIKVLKKTALFQQENEEDSALPPSLSTTATTTEKEQDDRKRVFEIFSDMGTINVEIKKLYRFKPNEKSNKPPLIRVQFNTPHCRHAKNEDIRDIQAYILKAAKLLKNSPYYKNIRIGNDLTDSQLTQQNPLRGIKLPLQFYYFYYYL